ncbi:thiamine pyrophosphate-dependent enzyme [Actinopolymorpha sp. B11F2]|uniref:thiamine pyrophosphate-dependent enzyme n=1 Tax=Actinopolymorpha sp. B11F2 TaxID=3160862 RepID=UPI0032E418EA
MTTVREATVREATYDVLRDCGLRTVFANPGSTEVPFLAGMPDDFQFVLALHEGSVVGMATGHAIATSHPALAILHTTAGLGNAVGALATARVNCAPLVVLVGQQDRRHLALEPFLAGRRLDALAGAYPVWADQPVLPQDVPAAIRRAWHEAATGRGPALVVVPMDDWSAEIDPAAGLGLAAPQVVRRASAADAATTAEIAKRLDAARTPAVVVGAGADDPATWQALTALVERLGCPVWQESFGARAGFPQDHPLFAGHLPAGRGKLRGVLETYDVVVVVGAPAFRQYPYEPGPLVPAGVSIIVVSDDPAEVHHSVAALGVVADPALTCAHLATLVTRRSGPAAEASPPVRTGEAPQDRGEHVGGRPLLRAAHVFAALAQRLPADVVLVEETPSTRPDLHRLLPARAPRGFVSAAMGGLGFALPAAAGLRMGDPSRPVVAVVGDGSAMYGIQALWSAVRYGCGVLFVVLSNGGYAIMDRLAERHGGRPPWPGFDGVDIHALAGGLGCPARRIDDHATLTAVLDEVVPTLAGRQDPLLLDIRVVAEEHFDP